MTSYLVPSAGTYLCRPIAATDRISVHAYGAAIDINVQFSDYWLWAKAKDGNFAWRNRIPGQIAEIFERHGFIWGAKWHHFDTMHFEYRPEIIALAKKGWPHRPSRPLTEDSSPKGVKPPPNGTKPSPDETQPWLMGFRPPSIVPPLNIFQPPDTQPSASFQAPYGRPLPDSGQLPNGFQPR
jgi:hypothetical protein